MKIVKCNCSQAEWLPMENQWEPPHTCEDCHKMEMGEFEEQASEWPQPIKAAEHAESVAKMEHQYDMYVDDDLPF